MKNQIDMEDIKNKVLKINKLGAFPHIVIELLKAIGDDRTKISDLTRIIEADMALTSKIIRLANSAFYSYQKEITTINRAILIIGFQEIQLLAIGIGLSDFFEIKKIPSDFDAKGLWIHSLAVGFIANFLAEESGHAYPGEVMISGLLHDLGKLVLVCYLHNELHSLMNLTKQGVPYFEAEKMLGFSHTEIGYWLAKNWDLPDVHISAIRFHHNLIPECKYTNSVSIISIANMIAKNLKLGLVQESPKNDIPTILQEANLTIYQCKKIAEKSLNRLPKIIESWLQAMT